MFLTQNFRLCSKAVTLLDIVTLQPLYSVTRRKRPSKRQFIWPILEGCFWRRGIVVYLVAVFITSFTIESLQQLSLMQMSLPTTTCCQLNPSLTLYEFHSSSTPQSLEQFCLFQVYLTEEEQNSLKDILFLQLFWK